MVAPAAVVPPDVEAAFDVDADAVVVEMVEAEVALGGVLLLVGAGEVLTVVLGVVDPNVVEVGSVKPKYANTSHAGGSVDE